ALVIAHRVGRTRPGKAGVKAVAVDVADVGQRVAEDGGEAGGLGPVALARGIEIGEIDDAILNGIRLVERGKVQRPAGDDVGETGGEEGGRGADQQVDVVVAVEVAGGRRAPHATVGELAIEGEPVEPVDVGGIDDPVEGAVKAGERVEIAFAAVDQIGATLAAGAGGGSSDEDVREAVAVHVPGRRDVPAELDKHAGPENVAVHPVDAGEINRMRKLSHERSPPSRSEPVLRVTLRTPF